MESFLEDEAIQYIAHAKGQYIPYIGAGVSAESGVLMADQICDQVRAQVAAGRTEDEIDAHLDWENSTHRYSNCIEALGTKTMQVQYFRGLLAGKIPSFAHYALATLIQEGVLSNIVLTTNFDKFVESAFVGLGDLEAQAIRTEEEYGYLDLDRDKTYVLKLHGDYDTYSIKNTVSELVSMSRRLRDRVVEISLASGMVVLGASGFESSIQQLFNELQEAAKDGHTLSYGLLWGVYMGSERPEGASAAELEAELMRAVETSVNPRIVTIIEQTHEKNRLAGFFPIWGAGEFLSKLVQHSCEPEVANRTTLYLSHPMRLRRVLRNAGVTDDGIERHVKKLITARERLLTDDSPAGGFEPVEDFDTPAPGASVQLVYGNIGDPKLLSSEPGLAAAVSADDTTISAGGGVALALLEGAGTSFMLNELAKHQPIEQNTAIATSGGELPVHYVIHAAAMQIQPDGTHAVDVNDVRATAGAVLDIARGVELDVLWMPLLAAGAGPVSSEDSLRSIADAIREHAVPDLKVCVVIFAERLLPRESALRILRERITEASTTPTS